MTKFFTILLILLTLALPVSVRAQYYSINIDYKTMAAMSEAYATENAMEALHNENIQKIYESYKAAEVASAGIFASKYLDRKALTDLNLWNDEQENRYYRRIYNIVSKRIIPKTITCAELMIEDPATALYWGSFLLRTCEDTRSLCQQFESVVTNSTLNFKDIAFVEIADELKSIFNITNIGNIDWKSLFEHIGDDIENSFTEDNIKADLDNLISKGVGLAGAGYRNAVGSLMQGSCFDGTFQDKLGSIITLIDNASNMYEQYKDMSTNEILTSIIGQDNISGLFKASDYSITQWLTDYKNREDDTEADAKKVAGASTATFTVTCHDGGTLGKGSTSYKCDDCGSSISNHTKQCSMYTSLKENEPVQSDKLKAEKAELEKQIKSIQKKQDALNKENSDILRSMSKAETQAEYLQLQNQYNANKTTITELQTQLDDLNHKILDIEDAILDAENGERQQTDDYTRIPSLMQNMKNAYHIDWSGNGTWSGNSFIRTGTIGSVQGKVTFKATISISRKPKYFLGVKIHRAIVQIDWELTSEWADSNIADILKLDPSNGDEENARLVNEKMLELKEEYPNCDVSVEYTRTRDLETEDTDGTYHLLWASDRLEIARGIEARLARIYTDLVMVEKYMHYRHSCKAWINDLIPKLNSDKGRRQSIAEQCRKRWMRYGGSKEAMYREEDY